MNLYIRFFNEEVLVENVDQAIDFLTRLPDVTIDDAICKELVAYVESKNPFPKRFKVHAKSYFIVIKTTATTMEEFKAYAAGNGVAEEAREAEKEALARTLTEERKGWYQARMAFKRVIAVPGTSKFRYVDNEFEAKLKADSIQDCYDKVVDHLRNRSDVDPRSQFPSIKGRNFTAEYLGE